MDTDLTVTILAKNAADTIGATLDSCIAFPDVLVFDTGSNDQTIEIAKRYPNVRVVEAEFKGFGPAHNAASALARFDWILSLDSDEVVSSELMENIFCSVFYSFWNHENCRKNSCRKEAY